MRARRGPSTAPSLTVVGAGPDAPAVARRARPGSHPASLALERHPWSTVMAVAAIGAVCFAATRVAVHDPATLDVRGDEASFVYSALSLRGGDLAYGQRDQERWLDLDWAEQPHGLFLQRYGEGWAFAKPYGFSALLMLPVAAAGLRGVSYVGAALVLGYAGCWYAAGRHRWDRSTALAVAATATVASHAWFYGFPAHADLFVAVLVGAAAVGGLRARMLGDGAALLVAAAAVGLLTTEKVVAAAALLPALAVAASRCTRAFRVGAILVAALVAGASMAPYLHYSEGRSWSAYGGERYYAPDVTPWSGGRTSDLVRWRTDRLETPSYALERLTNPSSDLPAAIGTFAVGRTTGVLTFLPIVPALLLSAVWAARRRPKPRHSTRQDVDRPMLIAAAVGLAAYSAFYLVLFTDNYYGGQQSIGNRYFLQISLLAAVVAVAAPVGRTAALRCAAFAVVWAAVVLGPNLRHADRAFHDLGHLSRVQRLLPFETTQTGRLFAPEPEGETSG